MTERNSRPRHQWLAGRVTVASGLASLLLSGCLAQQAELTQVERNLGSKISKLDQQTAKLDQREKELEQAINKAKLDVDKLISETRARLSQEISSVREADLPSMQGGLEKTGHQISQLRSRLDDIDHHEQQFRAGLDASTKRLSSLETAAEAERKAAKVDRDRFHEELTKELTRELNKSLDAMSKRIDGMTTTVSTMATKLGGRLDEHDKAIHAEEAKVQQQFDGQTRQLESQNHALIEQMGQYKKALDDFKKALNGLGEKVVQEEQRTNELSAKLLGRADTLTAKVETDAKTTTVHLQDVNRSVGSVAKALETMGSQVMTRVEEQDRRLDEINVQVGTLTHMINQLRVERNQVTKSASVAKEETPVQSSHRESPPAEAATSPPLNGRLAMAAEPPPMTAAREANRNPVQAREAYDRAITSFKQGNLESALQGFTQFLAEYPSSEFAPNAQYWLGECYYGRGDYPRAIEAFDRVKTVYPASEKVPAALLKKGFAYLALKDRYRASSVWRQVVDGYPRTPEAGKAMEKLAQLKQIR